MDLQTLLLTTLDDMSADDLKRFKLYLSGDLPEGCEPIGKGKLENRVPVDIVDLMLKAYEEKDVLKVTVHVLRKAELNNLAQKLEKKLGGNAMCRVGALPVPPRPVGQNGGSTTATTAATAEAAPHVSIQCDSGKVQAPVFNQTNFANPVNMTFN